MAAQTDIGLIRKTNQDRYLFHRLPDDIVLIAVADGHGGDPGGEVASGHVMARLKDLTTLNRENKLVALVSFFEQMDKDLALISEKNDALDGMATTLIIVAIKDNRACWVHSGDSRLYHLRNGKITQITQDQTFAHFLVQEKELAQDQVETHHTNQVLEQYIGCQDLRPETGQIDLEPQDMLILVSDGCYRSVTQKTMCSICRQSIPCVQMTEKLVNQALDAGGDDNVTAVIGKIR